MTKDDQSNLGNQAGFRDDNLDRIERFEVQDGSSFHSELTALLYNWWRSFAPRLPRVDEFSIAEHPQIAANLFLIRPLGDGRFEYRLNGEEVVQIVGQSLKGTIFSTEDANLAHQNLAAYHQKVIDSRSCHRCVGQFTPPGRTARRFESVDCPLVDKTGQVTRVVGLLVALT